MGTSGPGNITHIDNLYVKTFDVQPNTNVQLGDFVVVTTTGVRQFVATDTTGGSVGDFAKLSLISVVQAAEDANNLNSTDASLRKNQITCITKGSDWVVTMKEDVLPDSHVAIFITTVAPSVVDVRTSTDPAETLGVYKHKEFSTVARPSLLNDNGIVSTGSAF